MVFRRLLDDTLVPTVEKYSKYKTMIERIL